MFVGDVRHATTPSGSSWKLSGARWWPSWVTKVSKNRHVLRAIRRSSLRCLCRQIAPRSLSGGLRHPPRDERGERPRQPRTGRDEQPPRVGHGADARSSRCRPPRRGRRRARTSPCRWTEPRSASAAVTHSMRCFRETSIRQIVRMIASLTTHASCGRSASVMRPRRLSSARSARMPRAEVDSVADGGWNISDWAREKYTGKNTVSRKNSIHPSAGAGNSSQPSGEHQDRRRSHERTAQVVEDLPPVQRRERVLARTPSSSRTRGEQPHDRLPVAAHPPVHALHAREVVGGVVVDDLDVAREAGAQERALDQVVRQQAVLSEALLEHAREHVDLEDALAGERALAEEVLVGVGYGHRVRVDAGACRVQLGEGAAVGAGQAHADARLDEAVAVVDARLAGTPRGAVQRVGDRADEPLGRVARQHGVGVEGEHEDHAAPPLVVADADGHGGVAVARAARARARRGTLACAPSPSSRSRRRCTPAGAPKKWNGATPYSAR